VLIRLARLAILLLLVAAAGCVSRWGQYQALRVRQSSADPPAYFSAAVNLLQANGYTFIALDEARLHARVAAKTRHGLGGDSPGPVLVDTGSWIDIFTEASGTMRVSAGGVLVRADGAIHYTLAEEQEAIASAIAFLQPSQLVLSASPSQAVGTSGPGGPAGGPGYGERVADQSVPTAPAPALTRGPHYEALAQGTPQVEPGRDRERLASMVLRQDDHPFDALWPCDQDADEFEFRRCRSTRDQDRASLRERVFVDQGVLKLSPYDFERNVFRVDVIANVPPRTAHSCGVVVSPSPFRQRPRCGSEFLCWVPDDWSAGSAEVAFANAPAAESWKERVGQSGGYARPTGWVFFKVLGLWTSRVPPPLNGRDVALFSVARDLCGGRLTGIRIQPVGWFILDGDSGCPGADCRMRSSFMNGGVSLGAGAEAPTIEAALEAIRNDQDPRGLLRRLNQPRR